MKEIVCVTGSHGFLGTHLVKGLEMAGYEVVAGDREGNVSRGISYFVDLASYGNLHGQDDELEIYEANVTRVKRILRRLYKYTSVKGVIFTSSSSVTLPILTPYAKAKKEMETLVGDWSNLLPVVITRPYTMYGVGDKQHLTPLIFDSCLNGTPLTLDPTPTHDYVWVNDVVGAYLDLLFNAKELSGSIVELGTGIPTSNAELVLRIEQVTGKKANITGFTSGLREYDVKDWYCKNPYLKAFTPLGVGLTNIYEDIKGT